MASGAGCDQLTNGQLDCIVSEHYSEDYDQYGQQEYILSQNLLIENADGNSSYEAISSVVFDNQQELLWVGNHTGIVSSYYGRSLHRYSSFMPFHDADEVRCMMPTEQCIFSLSENCLACSSRSGQLIFQHRSPSLMNMQSMVMSSSNVVCLGGHQSLLVELDVETRDEIRQVEICENSCAILRLCSSYICCGHTDGMVSLLDPSSLCSVHQVTAHTGALSDFDVNGNQLVTCGFSYGSGGLIADRQLMIFDLRYLKSSAPLETAIDPMFLRFIPTYSNRICVVSQSGIFQLLEQGSSSVQSPIYGIPSEGASVVSFDRSSSSQFLGFGNSNGVVHVFHAPLDDLVFNHYSVETDFTRNNRFPSCPPPPAMDQEMELYYPPLEGTFLDPLYFSYPRGWDQYFVPPTHAEAWPQPDYTKHWFNIPAMANSKMNERMAKKQDPDHKQRAMIQKLYRKVEVKCSKYGVETFDFTHYNKTEFSGLEANVPNAYCNAMLQVLYFLSPLRRTLLNHLCDKEFCLSCELGFLWHMLDQRTFKACQPTNFLRAFRTIDSAQNMELVFSDTEEVPVGFNYAPLAELWNTFILGQIDKEFTPPSKHCNRSAEEDSNESYSLNWTAEVKPTGPDILSSPDGSGVDSPVKSIFGYNKTNFFVCDSCGGSYGRSSTPMVTNLVYPIDAVGYTGVPFSTVVEHSFNIDFLHSNSSQTWCDVCGIYQAWPVRTHTYSVPDILTLNCGLDSAEKVMFWKEQEEAVREAEVARIGPENPPGSQVSSKPCRYGVACRRSDCHFTHTEPQKYSLKTSSASGLSSRSQRNWIPTGLKLVCTHDGMVKAENVDEENLPSSWEEEVIIYYELYATVASVKDASGSSHVVSHIRPSLEYFRSGEAVRQWYLFNDFAVRPIDSHLATSFDCEWKQPCILYFVRTDLSSRHNFPVIDPITSDLLFVNESLVTPKRRNITFIPLSESELPLTGRIVGLDAEFVKLNQEENKSDGRTSTKHPLMSVARVTCVRESEPLHGVPFIDDYISTQDQVGDYLTKFSGIKPGDLDATISCKHLTTLKSTYLKLRYLISTKVIFVGHGLKNDFRVLNLIVPQDQVRDTVELFHLPQQRMISLKFLAWYFLGINIQSEIHDSIEDSNTAIKLYCKYNELIMVSEENFQLALDSLYDMGRRLQWKILENHPSFPLKMPAFSLEQRMLSAYQPPCSVIQPAYSAGQPVSSGDQPVYTMGQPISSGDQSVYSVGQPASSGDQPLFSAGQPASSGDQPVFSAGQPASSGDQPIYTMRQPISSGDQLVYSVGQPVFSVEEPVFPANESAFQESFHSVPSRPAQYPGHRNAYRHAITDI